eukprot:XP_011675479.1 PREDICTED: uncharacterized protein LOC105443689 [Strongylocentrotus purpuratus]
MDRTLKHNDLINICKLIPDGTLSKLGVFLEFNHFEIETFRKENEQDSFNMNGTFQMLRSWTDKDGSIERLKEALTKTGLGSVCDQILAGKTGQWKENKQGPSASAETKLFTADTKRHLPAQDLPPAQPAQPAQPGDDRGIDDETLRKLGKRLFTGVDELSSALGVQYADLKRYKAMNYQTGEVTAYGTITMLFNWREKIEPSEQRAKLGQALQKARLIRVKEEYHL